MALIGNTLANGAPISRHHFDETRFTDLFDNCFDRLHCLAWDVLQLCHVRKPDPRHSYHHHAYVLFHSNVRDLDDLASLKVLYGRLKEIQGNHFVLNHHLVFRHQLSSRSFDDLINTIAQEIRVSDIEHLRTAHPEHVRS